MEKIEQITTDCKQSVKTYTLIQKNIEDNLVDILQNCINNSVLFCKLNDAPVVTLNDAVTV